jgi:hypothetical protein
VRETEEGKWKDAIDVTRNKVWRVGAGRTGSVQGKGVTGSKKTKETKDTRHSQKVHKSAVRAVEDTVLWRVVACERAV